jgi:hypothetical protein
MPVNVNGLGVAQLVAVAFFAPFATVPVGVPDVAVAQKAAVMAWSLTLQSFSIIHQLTLGFVCLKRASSLGLSTEVVVADDEAGQAVAR